MALLASLPSRQADDAALDREAFFIALDGVSRYALSEASKAILRGGLPHGFFPSPVELRQQCDKAMKAHHDEAERIRRREETFRERREYERAVAARAPGWQERQKALMRRFHASLDADEAQRRREAEEAERAEVRARYGMTDEVMAKIDDQPLPGNFRRVG